MGRFLKEGQKRFTPGKMGDFRTRWLDCNDTTYAEYFYPPGPTRKGSVWLSIRRTNRSPLKINLTRMTEVELRALKDFLNVVLDEALPVSTRLDKEAQDAWDNGDDSFIRSYRSLPRLVERQRRESEHDPSLPGGSPGMDGGDEDEPSDDDDGFGDVGGDLPDDGPEDLGTEDDAAQVGRHAFVR